MFIVLNVIATRVEWMRAVGCAHDSVGRSNSRFPRVRTHLFVGDDLIDLHDYPIRGPIHEQIDPSRTAEMLHVTVRIGMGRMQNSYVGFDRRHRDQSLAANRILEELQIRIDLRQRGTDASAPGKEWQCLRRGLEARAEDPLLALPDFDFSSLSRAAK